MSNFATTIIPGVRREGPYARDECAFWITVALIVSGVGLALIAILVPTPTTPSIRTLEGVISGACLLVGGALTLSGILPPKVPTPPSQPLSPLKKLTLKCHELEAHDEEKLYYDVDKDTFTSFKEGLNKGKRLSLRKLDSGYTVKIPRQIGQGCSKTAYLQVQFKQGKATPIIRTVEIDPPDNLELTVLESLKGKPNCVQLQGVREKGEKKRMFYLEYCPLLSYSEARKTLTEAQSLHIFSGCLNGLAALSEAGFVHLDLGGNNILVTETHEARLADFGCTRTLKELSTREGIQKLISDQKINWWTGSRELVPPEIYENVGRFCKNGQQALNEITEKADVWSLGFEMCTLLRPQLACYLAISEAQRAEVHFNPFELQDGEDILAYVSALKTLYPENSGARKGSLEELLYEMCHPSPEKRPSPSDAASRLEKIAQKIDKST